MRDLGRIVKNSRLGKLFLGIISIDLYFHMCRLSHGVKTKKDKTELKEETKHEEVTVNRKRGAFFYVNIILAILILGFGAYAFVYPDQVSQWFGIGKSKSQNVRDSVTTKSKNIDAVDKDTAKIVQNDISEENATVEQPVEQPVE
jgi:hypothetical protein